MGREVVRTFDPAPVNAVMNHLAVHPWITGPGQSELDATDFIADRANIALIADHAAFLFLNKGFGTYEVHTQITPEGRDGSLALARKAAVYMFGETDCTRVVTYVPAGNRRAEALTLAMGFEFTHFGEPWMQSDGRRVPTAWYSLSKDQFQCQQAQ